MHERTCPECGATFAPDNGSLVCCSDKCKHERQQRLARERAARNNEAKKLAALDCSQRAREADERNALRIRRRRADLAYKSLHVPVVTRTLDDGRVVETRGQPCIAPWPSAQTRMSNY